MYNKSRVYFEKINAPQRGLFQRSQTSDTRQAIFIGLTQTWGVICSNAAVTLCLKYLISVWSWAHTRFLMWPETKSLVRSCEFGSQAVRSRRPRQFSASSMSCYLCTNRLANTTHTFLMPSHHCHTLKLHKTNENIFFSAADLRHFEIIATVAPLLVLLWSDAYIG
jgi:hypothetical protein